MSHRSIPPQRGFFPQPVYVIGAAGEDGSPHFTLITWITCCGVEPVTLMFSSRREKRTPASVLRTGCFSASLVSVGMVDAADYFGNTSGHNTKKEVDTGVRWERGPVTGAPVLEDSPWVFECSLVGTKEIAGNTLFFGEVKNILIREDLTETGYAKLDVPLLDPAIYAPPRYYELGKPIFRVGESLSRYTPVGRRVAGHAQDLHQGSPNSGEVHGVNPATEVCLVSSQTIPQEVLDTIAPCGLNCRKCYSHVDGPIGRHAKSLQDLLGPNFSVYAQRFSQLGLTKFNAYPQFKELLSYLAAPDCSGCRKGDGCKYPGCGVRECLVQRRIAFCYQCNEFPCKKSGFDPHLEKRWIAMNMRMKEVGPEQFLFETRDETRYK